MSLPKDLWRERETCRQLAQGTMGHPALVMFGLAELSFASMSAAPGPTYWEMRGPQLLAVVLAPPQERQTQTPPYGFDLVSF